MSRSATAKIVSGGEEGSWFPAEPAVCRRLPFGMDPADLDVNDEASENAVWVATEPRSGRFSGVETRSDVAGLSEPFNELRLRGQKYLEVRMPDRDYPVVTVVVRRPAAWQRARSGVGR